MDELEQAMLYKPHPNIVEERRIFDEGGWQALDLFYQKEMMRMAAEGVHVIIAMPIGYQGISGYTFSSMLNTQMPPSTFIQVSGHFVHMARNEIVKKALTMKTPWTHMLWVDSDVSFPRYAIPRMLRYDVDAVGALCPMKSPVIPMKIVVYERDSFLPTGGMKRLKVSMKDKPWMIKPEFRDRLHPVGGTGFSLVVTKRAIYDDLGYPYFSDYDIARIRAGDDYGFMGEDILFFKRISQKGYQPYADMSFICEHWLNGTSNVPGIFFEHGRFMPQP